ncbi:MAG: HoxN/HupN/NixA family nickel/cobalt transporter [Vulcanimicrobiaceae bacterium]
MIVGSAFAVFALGLRHGADPDHLAAIDNLTRRSAASQPRLSRFAGTLFASGHTVMVLAIAAVVGYLGTRFSAHASLIETIGTWLSIVVLSALGTLNAVQLARNETQVAGLRTRLFSPLLRNGTGAWLAVPIGLLFGFGFETSSQIAAYALALGTQAGVSGALIVGAAFCLGMICTDTLDSLLVHRLLTYRSDRLPGVTRLWTLTVTALAFGIALFELAQILGRPMPLSNLTMSAIVMAILLCAFGWVFIATTARTVKER